MFQSITLHDQIKLNQKQLHATEEKENLGIAIGIIILLGGLFLALAAHRIYPSGTNIISDLNQIGKLLYVLTLTAGTILLSLSAYYRYKTSEQRMWDAHSFLEQAEKKHAQPGIALHLYHRAALAANNSDSLLKVADQLRAFLGSHPEAARAQQAKVVTTCQVCAETAYAQKNFDLALKCINQIASYQKLSFEQQFFKIVCLLQLSQIEEVRINLERWGLEKLNSASPIFDSVPKKIMSDLFCQQGKIYFDAGKYHLAQNAFAKAETLYPIGNWHFYFWMVSLARQGKYSLLILRLGEQQPNRLDVLVESVTRLDESEEIKDLLLAYTGCSLYRAGFLDKAHQTFMKMEWLPNKDYLSDPYTIYLLCSLKKGQKEGHQALKLSSFTSLDDLLEKVKVCPLIVSSDKELLYCFIGQQQFMKKKFKGALAAYESCQKALPLPHKLYLVLSYLNQNDAEYLVAAHLIKDVKGCVLNASEQVLFDSINAQLGGYYLNQYKIRKKEESEKRMLDRVACWLNGDLSGRESSESYKKKALHYYETVLGNVNIKPRMLFDFKDNLISLQEISESFREFLFERAGTFENANNWTQAAFLYSLVMRHPEGADFFDYKCCYEAARQFLAALEPGLMAAQEPQNLDLLLQLCDEGMEFRTRLLDLRKLLDPFYRDSTDSQIVIINFFNDSKDQFVFEMGYKLSLLKAKLLEVGRKPLLMIYQEYQYAYSYFCCLNSSQPETKFMAPAKVDNSLLEEIKKIVNRGL